MRVEDARDEESVMIPDVKNGNLTSASAVLEWLNIKQDVDWNTASLTSNPVWGKANISNNYVTLKTQNINRGLMPNVTGMGARDAVYLLESRGVSVRIKGRGKVISQSIEPGRQIKTGEACELVLK
ncbi:PASTA domain-containing protein, partial [Parabacteroides distasonis]